jgi:hypothetical protein
VAVRAIGLASKGCRIERAQDRRHPIRTRGRIYSPARMALMLPSSEKTWSKNALIHGALRR